jgi:hypothetical protein
VQLVATVRAGDIVRDADILRLFGLKFANSSCAGVAAKLA